MSTRSDLIILRKDGTFARQYCRSDGYLSWNGVLLHLFWNDDAKVQELSKLGDLSTLGRIIGEKHDFDYRRKPTDDSELKRLSEMCLAYGRDRGEEDTEASVFPDLRSAMPPADSWTEYSYAWMGEVADKGGWYLIENPGPNFRLVPLIDALKADPASLKRLKEWQKKAA